MKPIKGWGIFCGGEILGGGIIDGKFKIYARKDAAKNADKCEACEIKPVKIVVSEGKEPKSL